jgi:antitoxin (DNA-binding transcriptional repressor) of toxin-antitoxin stability system
MKIYQNTEVFFLYRFQANTLSESLPVMTTITLAELPETLQNLLQQIAQTGETLTITQNDQPLLIVSPAPKTTRAAFGSAKDTGKIIGDIVEPTSNLVTWDALS